MNKTTAAVVGLGYWGPNLARNIAQASGDFELVGLCDRDDKRLSKLGDLYPGARRYRDFDELLHKEKPQLVCVASPVASHHALTKAALKAGAHVLCEKPLAATVAEAEELLGVAEQMGRRLFVDHTFVYTGAVQAIRKAYAAGALGDLFYVDSVRINLGLFQPDVDVIWDLAPHDISIISHVIDRRPQSVRAIGSAHNPTKLVDVAHLTLEYEGGVQAHLHVSWLSPVKVRRMIFAGTKSSLIYDDLEASEKIKLYDHGVNFDVSDLEARKKVLVSYRRGDMRAPALDNTEALSSEFRAIAATLRGGDNTPAMGSDGLNVLRVLAAAGRSLEQDGARVTI